MILAIIYFAIWFASHLTIFVIISLCMVVHKSLYLSFIISMLFWKTDIQIFKLLIRFGHLHIRSKINLSIFQSLCMIWWVGVFLCVSVSEWGLRPPKYMYTYRLNWARRTSWRWRDEWDDTALQIQDSKFEPWCSESEHAISRSRRLSTILNLYEWAARNFYFHETCVPEWRTNPRSPDFPDNHCTSMTRAPCVYSSTSPHHTGPDGPMLAQCCSTVADSGPTLR